MIDVDVDVISSDSVIIAIFILCQLQKSNLLSTDYEGLDHGSAFINDGRDWGLHGYWCFVASIDCMHC